MTHESVDARLSAPLMRDGRCPLVSRSSAGDAHFRWSLSRKFEDSGHYINFLPWLMLNPSKANGMQEDPTLLRVMDFSWRWGFPGCILWNIFPFRTPSPRDLAGLVVDWDQRQAWDIRDSIWGNHSTIRRELVWFDAMMVAWGSQPGALGAEVDAWSDNLLEDIASERDVKLWCLGTTKAGDPIHPMARGKHRVPADRKPQRWER